MKGFNGDLTKYIRLWYYANISNNTHSNKFRSIMDSIKIMTATEFNKNNAVYRLLNILQTYKSVVITLHGDKVLVIHQPDAPVIGIEESNGDSPNPPTV